MERPGNDADYTSSAAHSEPNGRVHLPPSVWGAATIGRLLREDDEYKRCGTANIFLRVEPLTGRTVIKATERRTAIDFAHFLRDLCDGPY